MMTNAEYTDGQAIMRAIVSMLLTMDLAGMLERMNQAEASVPLLDPTLWLQKGADFHVDVRVARALRTAQVELQRIAAERYPATVRVAETMEELGG